jgi:hypothetical protein
MSTLKGTYTGPIQSASIDGTDYVLVPGVVEIPDGELAQRLVYVGQLVPEAAPAPAPKTNRKAATTQE